MWVFLFKYFIDWYDILYFSVNDFNWMVFIELIIVIKRFIFLSVCN